MRLLTLLTLLVLLIGCGISSSIFDYKADPTPFVRDRTTGKIRPVTQEEIKADPCYWCARVLNNDPDNPPFDCTSDCPCENAYPWYGPQMIHTGKIHDNGTFALYNAQDGDAVSAATGGTPRSGCIPRDESGKAVVTLVYSMKYPCDSLDQFSAATTLTAALFDPADLTTAVIEQSAVVDTLDLVPEPCCLQDNQCILSRSFNLRFTPKMAGTGQTSNYVLTFTVDHEHDAGAGHATVDWSSPHQAGTANRSKASNWDHEHEYTTTVSFCTFSISKPLEQANEQGQLRSP